MQPEDKVRHDGATGGADGDTCATCCVCTCICIVRARSSLTTAAWHCVEPVVGITHLLPCQNKQALLVLFWHLNGLRLSVSVGFGRGLGRDETRNHGDTTKERGSRGRAHLPRFQRINSNFVTRARVVGLGDSSPGHILSRLAPCHTLPPLDSEHTIAFVSIASIAHLGHRGRRIHMGCLQGLRIPGACARALAPPAESGDIRHNWLVSTPVGWLGCLLGTRPPLFLISFFRPFHPLRVPGLHNF